MVIVAGPKKPLLSTEMQALKVYLDKGGRLLIMLEAFEDGGLKEFLAGYGVDLDNGLILDVNQVSRALGRVWSCPWWPNMAPPRLLKTLRTLSLSSPWPVPFP